MSKMVFYRLRVWNVIMCFFIVFRRDGLFEVGSVRILWDEFGIFYFII